MEASFQSELRQQRDEETTITVPDDIDGPRNIAEWYTDEHVKEALRYYADITNTPRDPEQVIIAKNFFECVLGNKDEHNSMPSRKRLKDKDTIIEMGKTVGKVTNYLHLTPDGDRRETTNIPIDTGDDRFNQVVQVLMRGHRDIIERIDGMERNNNERFESVERNNNERFERMERINNERFERMERINNERFERMEGNIADLRREANSSFIQRLSSIARLKNQLRGVGGRPGTSAAYLPVANDEDKYPNEEGIELLTSVEQISSMNTARINEYLRFYGLMTVGNLQEKKYNLLRYVGVNYEPIVSSLMEVT